MLLDHQILLHDVYFVTSLMNEMCVDDDEISSRRFYFFLLNGKQRASETHTQVKI